MRLCWVCKMIRERVRKGINFGEKESALREYYHHMQLRIKLHPKAYRHLSYEEMKA